MKHWNESAPELRAILAFSLALSFFVISFLKAPADDLRVAAIALIGGCLTSIICWQHFSGWDIFTAGCSFAVAGAFHDTAPENWLFQACLPLLAVFCWYLGTRIGEDWVVFPASYQDEHHNLNMQRLVNEWRKGSVVTLGIFILAFVVCVPFAEALAPLAFPVTALVSAIVCNRWHIKRPIWPILAALTVLPAAGAVNIGISQFLKMPPPHLADPWLLGGMMTAGSVMGVWLARWRYYAKLNLARRAQRH